MPLTLEHLGWDSRWDDALDDARQTFGDVVIGRVAADFGVEVRVLGEFGDERATLTGRLRFTEGLRPAVGDFVALQGEAPSLFVVDVLPRQTWLGRQAAGKKTGVQIIGTNLDKVFVVTSFNEDFNINRIERYLVAIREGGASPVIVVNKADLVADDERTEFVAALRERVGADVAVVTTSAMEDGGLVELETHIRPRETSSFVGSSGVGKSSIVNALIGQDVQAVEGVRESDARGRHTTTHRELFILPSGALVIDTPGMREFQLLDDQAGLDAFEDIEELAEMCRFRDCAHETEPGCAVREAVEDGGLSSERLESWRKLHREMEHQRLRVDVAARREKEKSFGRVVKNAKEAKKGKGKDD